MVEFTRRELLATSAAAAVGASVSGVSSASTDDDAPLVRGELKRFSSTALGAEVTGPFVFDDGTLLYSLQHPSTENQAPFDRGGVGYFSGFQFSMTGTNDDFEELSPPSTSTERERVRSARGSYELLGVGGESINDGAERLGVTQTPDGTDITRSNFTGTQYGTPGSNPDCNQFVPTASDGSAGYLFTNWENSPGNISRIPIERTAAGELEARLDDAINLANTEPFRAIGGTRINCYGDLTPWETMISAEENYAHTRVSLTSTVGDIVADGTGVGHIGGAQFWNRPNPTEIQSAIDSYYGENAWTVQGWWALDGVEFLAYYLGADVPDDSSQPIDDQFPNPYRYGYFVDIREPAADVPRPVKYYVMGRAAWEAPDIQTDGRTVYGCSDGDSKGIYKFVADRPIQSYDDPMEIAGTLYAPKITNEDAANGGSPASVGLSIEWLELGHASNREVASWIEAFDEVTQAAYLRAHTEDYSTGDPITDELLEEADRTVIEQGNQNYITNEEIVEWARQHEQGTVDPELRKVPFLETRAAAKEIGATIEFNKAEGVDSHASAGPGDPIYFAISELNDDMASGGDLAMERVDGGVVYRGILDHRYNVSTLEPVIVGPNASDPAAIADDALINVDNIAVMDDGRVLCCEDADQLGRSYSNDCLYVFEPDEDGGHHGPPWSGDHPEHPPWDDDHPGRPPWDDHPGNSPWNDDSTDESDWDFMPPGHHYSDDRHDR
ncbi:alkaline phosphatase PhoX [Halocatena halophila]|uniref:alkaline phosphatase PhoX n=1 Tax=Halocatena halophila TaxID=2814576 RepID=UPI002ED3E438